ncbi:peroxiredoxin [Candidatus Methylacidiphilum fumarolicum]|uniref:Peroxiredoxin n=2 Tax=Candidatus Methylacidiphilum fumarolicum TaxID=591154 RepID=I0K0R9_METFB|nr:redoxin domain-containing protein [Candidatus Methylacidiphilum fumarolicum]MBW6414790.1 redoxin domain-containing protein [Candidatus Methylacidiphilum fumarolicum]TFE67486.1 peroxiredoxin [Candidatus Methylacidiphilum fumarolicum]TFE71413.1 peroxiredoxin [Candidatus Methylacidiphilum fumarolicum]TFE73094.1 peroxiredoxin [Candidatus Methylacidiphilum fumarolicum]TFE77056.1 peroxiredoxin [Candidatus Methylacidiphilum fumarolicum]
MALAVGSLAPDFTLSSKYPEGIKQVHLKEELAQNNVVLLFFPMAFTPVCTQEMCTMTASINEYAQLQAKVFGISVDNPFAQEAWAKHEGIKIPLLSDLNKVVCKAYDVLLPGLIGIGDVAARAVYLIDRNQQIRYVEVTPTPLELPSFERLKDALKTVASQ